MIYKCTMNQHALDMIGEVVVRCLLLGIFLITEQLDPFIRIIQPEEMWLYRNPVAMPDTINTRTLFTTLLTVPLAIILLFSIIRKDRVDCQQAILAITLAFAFNGIITNCIKLLVGRPRPDFLYRCFPDGKFSSDMKCTGESRAISEGRKSFPSGHSSFSFTGLGFTSLYLASKLHCFESQGRGKSWRLCVSGAPLLAAIMIALTRTSDYRHHWQDVVVGSIIGFCVAYTCYRQYYPLLSNPSCDRSYATRTLGADISGHSDLRPLEGIMVAGSRGDSKLSIKHI